MADLARDIQTMLEKLTADEKAAFNFVIGLARETATAPRAYRVHVVGMKRDWDKPGVPEFPVDEWPCPAASNGSAPSA